MTYRKGESGNPSGRPKGIPNKVTRLRQSIEAHIPDVLNAMVTAAKGGDSSAARLLLERTVAPIRGHATPIEMPELETAGTLTEKAEAVVAAIGGGRLPPDVGAGLLSVLGHMAKIIETDDLERRIAALEEKR